MSKELKRKEVPFNVESFESKTIKQDGSDDEQRIGIVRGYASTFNNEDRAKDIMHPNAFDRTIEDHYSRGNRGIRILYNHDRMKLIGHAPIESVRVDQKGLFIEAHINLESPLGQEVYSFVKMGVLRDFSIGYYEKEFSYNNETGINTVLEVDLLETSIVTEPMNQLAQITEVKAMSHIMLPLANDDAEWDEKSAIERIGGGSSGYLISKQLEGETVNLFPVADMVDGELVAIPKALHHAARVLKGFKRFEHEHFSDTDREQMKKSVSRYYRELGLAEPFSDGALITRSDVECLKDLSEVEEMLEAVGFSNNARKAFISRVKALTPASSRDGSGESDDRDDTEQKSLEENIDGIKSLVETLEKLNQKPNTNTDS
jgi:HK97 family phage prohead protease